MDGLSAPHTKKGRLQRACLDLLREHEVDGALPTSIRFLFYELLDRGVIPKVYRHPDGREKPRKPAQDVADAVLVLREAGLPWSWIVDETRTLEEWRYASSVYQYVEDTLPLARIDLWAGEPPPLILCESRSLAGVLRDLARDYLCPIAATNGQAGGFLHTEVAPLVAERAGRRVLSHYGALDWQRVAITRTQIEERSLPVVGKTDYRFKPARTFEAVETEALGQAEIMRLLSAVLEDAAPEPLSEVLEHEERQRVQVRERLAGETR